jgi:hypothetical protein
MKQILYVLQFKGQAGPSPDADNVLTAATKAANCTVRSVADASGVSSTIEETGGDAAQFESVVTFTGDKTFVESGSISFGDGSNKLYFSTVGNGHIDASADPNLKHGSVIWKIDRGEGQLKDASGLITSNFTVSSTGEVVDNHFGLIFLQ